MVSCRKASPLPTSRASGTVKEFQDEIQRELRSGVAQSSCRFFGQISSRYTGISFGASIPSRI